jgi:aryl-alcohol dehydrogenase-like predicted oxidoreductase
MTYDQDAAQHLPRVTDAGELRGEMLYRKFGRTGETVSAIGLGGSHIGKKDLSEQDAVRLMHQAIDRGITFMDNSWDYNNGRSEELMGVALSQDGYRKKVFLMTKIDARDKDLATTQLNDSLARLKTDHIDLLQFHEIIRYEDPDRIFRPGGALEAALEAKKAGKIRFIGFTGHKDPHVHLYMLAVAEAANFHFDAVLHPSNLMDAHFRSFGQLVMPRLVEKRIAVQTMKPFGGEMLLKSGVIKNPVDCLHYALNLPADVVITGIDKPEILDQAFTAAKTFKRLDGAEFASLVSQTAQTASAGRFEVYKVSAHFDSTAKHPEWLGPEDQTIKDLVSAPVKV